MLILLITACLLFPPLVTVTSFLFVRIKVHGEKRGGEGGREATVEKSKSFFLVSFSHERVQENVQTEGASHANHGNAATQSRHKGVRARSRARGRAHVHANTRTYARGRARARALTCERALTRTHTPIETYAHTVRRHTRPAKHARDGRQVLRAPLATSPTWPYPFSSPTPSCNTNVTATYEGAYTLKGRSALILAMEILFYRCEKGTRATSMSSAALSMEESRFLCQNSSLIKMIFNFT